MPLILTRGTSKPQSAEEVVKQCHTDVFPRRYEFKTIVLSRAVHAA